MGKYAYYLYFKWKQRLLTLTIFLGVLPKRRVEVCVDLVENSKTSKKTQMSTAPDNRLCRSMYL